ncbi:hypothetical protein QZH41_012548, partial [Actinostola sp. cb2023]
ILILTYQLPILIGIYPIDVCFVVEKDVNFDVLWTWTFPSVSSSLRDVLLRKCCLKSEKSQDITPYLYGQYAKQWYYLYTSTTKNSTVMTKVTHVALAIVAKDFNPEKYKTLCRILCSKLLQTGSPASILQGYLSVFTKGSCKDDDDDGAFTIKEYDPRKAYVEKSVKDVVNIFGVETILIYTALMLKKRVAVYSPRLDTLLDITRALPLLVWHRQNWSILYPYVHLEDDELDDLRSNAVYIAGFTDASIEDRTELYDLFINVAAGEISIPSHAKETFQMGKVHKDIAMYMVDASKDEGSSDQSFIKELSTKTKDLIANLKKLAVESEDGSEPKVTLEGLKERKLTAVMEDFLFNLAAAEGMV